MSFLEISNLSFTYPGGIQAVNGLDLSVEKGESLALIGSNAAGKSTLALLVKGVLTPEAGSIIIDGMAWNAGKVDPRVGLLFSNPENQLVTSIVEEDIAFGLEVEGLASEIIREKVDSVLSALGIEHLRDRMPHRLSGGEQQMTALAGVMVTEPDLLILDEPTAYLDPFARAAVDKVVASLSQKGTTVILITHDLSRAANASRVAIMDEGKICMVGSPAFLFGQHLEPEKNLHLHIGSSDVPFVFRLASRLASMSDKAGIAVTEPVNSNNLVNVVSTALTGGGRRSDPSVSNTDTGNEVKSHHFAKEPILTMVNVTFSYPGQESGVGTIGTINDVHMKIPEGSVTLLCGPNGSGKSTLLQLINGLIRPDSGKVLFKGEELSTLKRYKGGIAGKVTLLFQNPEKQLFSETVFEDIAFGPRNLGLDPGEVERRVSTSMVWVGLKEELLERPVHSLSGGQMRRVGIAGVLAMEPDLLVLDEPTDGLDPAGVREFFSQARKYCESTGATILMAAHEIPEQVAMVDHLWYMEKGDVVLSGSPDEIMKTADGIVPDTFFPEHLVIRRELERRGVTFLENDLSPDRVLERIVALLS